MMPAVVSASTASPWVDEAAVVPLAAVALQKVLAGARLVLGVVVLGDSSFPVVVSEPSVAPEPSTATTAVEPAPIV